jgi:hypothetical protein
VLEPVDGRRCVRDNGGGDLRVEVLGHG